MKQRAFRQNKTGFALSKSPSPAEGISDHSSIHYVMSYDFYVRKSSMRKPLQNKNLLD